jgi:hypothetical protein
MAKTVKKFGVIQQGADPRFWVEYFDSIVECDIYIQMVVEAHPTKFIFTTFEVIRGPNL